MNAPPEPAAGKPEPGPAARDTAQTPTPRSAHTPLGPPSRQTDPLSAGPSQRTLIIFGVIATLLILSAVIGLAASRSSPTRSGSVVATGLGAPTDTTYPSAPAADVQRIHTALHDMGAQCTPNANQAAQIQIGHDVDQLITFATRYPNARFTVDGENGQALNLLLIARDEMRTCAPAAAARANQALPSPYRAAPSPTTPATAATDGSPAPGNR